MFNVCFNCCIFQYGFVYLQHISQTDPVFKMFSKLFNPTRLSHGCKMPQVPGARYCPNLIPGPPITRPGGLPNTWKHGLAYFQYTVAYLWKHWLTHVFDVYLNCCIIQHVFTYFQHISKTDPIFILFSKHVNPYGLSHGWEMPEVSGAMYCPNSSPGPPITWPGGFQVLDFYSRSHTNQIFLGHPGRFIESSGGTDGHAEIWLGIRFSTPGPPGTWYQVAGVWYHVPGTRYILVFDYGESNNHVVFLLLKA